MDKVRVSTGVDAAVSQFGVTGRGVIVALLDNRAGGTVPQSISGFSTVRSPTSSTRSWSKDTQTGVVNSYVNPDQNLASVADTAAFSGANTPPPGEDVEATSATSALASSVELDYARYAALTSTSTATKRPRARVNGRSEIKPESVAAPAACNADSQSLCLNSTRFKIQVAWSVPSQGTSGNGTAVPLTGDTGYFWFFSSNNVELVIKVLDGRGLNGKFWVFYGALSNVQYTITVTDTQTSAIKVYNNPSGTMASVADTGAF